MPDDDEEVIAAASSRSFDISPNAWVLPAGAAADSS
jgi:hypothetical protein